MEILSCLSSWWSTVSSFPHTNLIEGTLSVRGKRVKELMGPPRLSSSSPHYSSTLIWAFFVIYVFCIFFSCVRELTLTYKLCACFCSKFRRWWEGESLQRELSGNI